MTLLYSHMKKHSPLSKHKRNKLLQLVDIITRKRNRMRHTGASHWLIFHQNQGKAAQHLGRSPTMLHSQRKALVTRKESDEFFALWEQAR